MSEMAACRECGYDDATTTLPTARMQLLAGAAQIATAITDSPIDTVARRPDPEVWSSLEYACHVRDVLLAQRERTLLALVEENPSFAPIYRDRRATTARYASEAPSDVADHVRTAADLLVWVFDGLDDEQLARPCMYNYPEPAQKSVAWLLVHTTHEVIHHEGDVRTGLERSPG
jgi:DinB family protein